MIATRTFGYGREARRRLADLRLEALAHPRNRPREAQHVFARQPHAQSRSDREVLNHSLRLKRTALWDGSVFKP